MSSTTSRRVIAITSDDAQTYRCCQLCTSKCEKKDFFKCPKFMRHITLLSRVWNRTYRVYGDRMAITISQ